MAKAKKLAKTGRERTGTEPGSGKRRSDVRAGAQPANGRRARIKRAAKAGGPSIPLRDLVRDGLPRSKKAHHPPGAVAGTPWVHRRTKTAHGLKAASGSTLMQHQPPRLVHVGTMRVAVPKR